MHIHTKLLFFGDDMQAESDYKFERYERYFGDIKQVKRIIDDCNICGSKLVLSHLSDYRNLIIQESARCPECGGSGRKIVHVLN